ncbi:unnamed protein product [Chrysoparadoxa australica]
MRLEHWTLAFISLAYAQAFVLHPPPLPATSLHQMNEAALEAAVKVVSNLVPSNMTDTGSLLGEEAPVNAFRRVPTSCSASAAAVVDSFKSLQEYMTLPISSYSLLDSSVISRVEEGVFRFQLPLEAMVGLDFTPTVDVSVELLDGPEQAIHITTLGSTLYGTVGAPMTTQGGSGTSGNVLGRGSARLGQTGRPEFVEVGLEARLQWSQGEEVMRAKRGLLRRKRHSWDTVSMRNTTSTNLGGLGCTTNVNAAVVLPPPYSRFVPSSLVGGAVQTLLRSVVSFLVPRFLDALVADYNAFREGASREEPSSLVSPLTGGGGVDSDAFMTNGNDNEAGELDEGELSPLAAEAEAMEVVNKMEEGEKVPRKPPVTWWG